MRKDFINYKEYLKSEHWRQKRNKIKEERVACEFCFSKSNLQVHHTRYRDDEGRSILYWETRDDLLLVCSACHNQLHEYMGELGFISGNKNYELISALKIMCQFRNTSIKDEAKYLLEGDQQND